MAKLLQMPLLFEEWSSPETSRAPHLPETNPTPDAAQRNQALDTERSWVVEAPAGSGKTGLLIQRFLKLLAYGGVEGPGEVLAITFTRKADAEMRRRVLEQLAAAAEDLPLPAHAGHFEQTTRALALAALDRDRALDWRLLDHPQSLNIRTIDSLCAEIARGTSSLADAGGRYAPTDDPDPLYQQAAERTLLGMGGPQALLTADLEFLLLHRDASPGDFTRLLTGMLAQREQWGELIPLDPSLLTEEALNEKVRPRLTRTLERLLAQELQAAADLVGYDLLHTLATVGHTLSGCASHNGDPHLLFACTQRADAPEAHAADLPRWKCLIDLVLTGGGEWRSSFRRNYLRLDLSVDQQQRLQYLVAAFRDRERDHPDLRRTLLQVRALPEAPYPEEQWRAVKSLCRVLRQALFELQALFAERRSCDFAEIALRARTLLQGGAGDLSDIGQTSPARLKHLLVDEMQDTSASQYDLLRSLVQDWDGTSRTLFLVGDPKQSIYEFRQARVERFLRLMQEGSLGTVPLGAIHLTANFRSQAALVEAFNGTFAQILPSPEDLASSLGLADVPFVAAYPTRPESHAPALGWHIDFAARDSAAPEADPVATQARQMRDAIEAYLRRARERSPAGPGDAYTAPKVAILARNRSHLAPVIQEFRQDHGDGPLPFRAVDIEPLGERQEILDLLSLTRALLHPGDRGAWLALLRSPVCGLSLADLLALTGEGANADPEATILSLVAARGHLLSPIGRLRLERTWSVMRRALDDVGRTPLATHVERTWRSLGADAFLQADERANAVRFLDLLHGLEAGPDPLSVSLLRRRLRTLYAQPNAPGANVELMTIHKAKGLEWDLVLIPALHRGSGRPGSEFLKWLEFDSPGTEANGADLLLAPIQSKGEEGSALYKWLNRRQCQREAAEAKRLLYVAATRAREELQLFATVFPNAAGDITRPRADSLLDAAWSVAESIANELRASSDPDAETLTLPAPHDTVSTSAPLALAAAAEEPLEPSEPRSEGTSPLVRLPLSFDPLSRFRREAGAQLPYPPAGSLPREFLFARPEASFAARAFGNVVHRFLDWIAACLNSGQSLLSLRAEVLGWQPRLVTSLRSEGLSPTQANAASHRTLKALLTSLHDPAGIWLLTPKTEARNESCLGGPHSPLRADRTFQAGAGPLVDAPPTHLWIVDYKTAELAGRSLENFVTEQRSQYFAQMRAYAQAAAATGQEPDKVVLALYFPLVPALVHWPGDAQDASGVVTYV